MLSKISLYILQLEPKLLLPLNDVPMCSYSREDPKLSQVLQKARFQKSQKAQKIGKGPHLSC
jgi:hypothetical protein